MENLTRTLTWETWLDAYLFSDILLVGLTKSQDKPYLSVGIQDVFLIKYREAPYKSVVNKFYLKIWKMEHQSFVWGH